ncbi:MAG: hypothetical protein HC882_06385 [Acidobacteria bacterium]|nr:hypothetical protein [Acidobacteriota bacterium]
MIIGTGTGSSIDNWRACNVVWSQVERARAEEVHLDVLGAEALEAALEEAEHEHARRERGRAVLDELEAADRAVTATAAGVTP